jgi:hypothetical protein
LNLFQERLGQLSGRFSRIGCHGKIGKDRHHSKQHPTQASASSLTRATMALNNVSRLGMRIQETLSERTRDMAIGRSSSAAYFDTGDDKVKNIQKQLDSNSDREKLDAMKRLIAVRVK